MSLTVKLHITNQLNLNLGQSSIINKTKFYTPRIRTKPIYHSNPLISSTSYNKPITTMHVPSYSSSIKSSLIDPDGGALVDLVVPERERAKKKLEAEALPPVRLTKIDVEWVHVISEGWASPLRGFMRESEYLQSLHFNCLRTESGSLVNMSLPMVLAIDDDTKTRIGSSPNVGLVGPNGDLVGILRSIEIYKHNKEERIARTWGTTTPGLPYVEEVITPAGNWLVGGDLEVLNPIKYNDGLDHYRLSPQQLRKEFDRRQADAVFAFQLRNPVHNGHALLMNDTRKRLLEMGYKNPILLLHPLGGFTKADDVPLDVRMEQHSKVLEDGILDPETTIVAIFPSPMHYAGPTEVEYGYVETDPTRRYGRFNEVLGKGAMKKVYKAIDEFLGIEVAWNQVKLNEVLRSPDDLQRLYSEVHLLSTLNHDSIIKFHASWIDVNRKTFNFITEMFTSGTLREYRKKYEKVHIRAIKCWARQILGGLVYLHGHDPPVIHRDLKCDNIFVNGHLGQVKIGDLGLAAILHGSQSAHSVIGTPEFMAPELYEEDYNELVDVYSFGLCVLEMLTSEYPYSECSNPAQIYKKVTSGKLPGAFYQIEDLEAQRFIGKCLVTASKRLSAKELLLDPFLTSDKDEQLPLKKLGSQNPFLSQRDMEKLKLSDPARTKMTITGKLNPDDSIFLKVQIADKDGSARNIYFPFDILTDTPIDVATEMVKELEITDWEPFEIADMIEGEISALVPHWRKRDTSHLETHQTFNCQDDHDDDDGPHHSFQSFSSCSSSQVSASGLIRIDETADHYDWLQDNLLDDTSSQSSSHSGTYSNLYYLSRDEHESNTCPTRGDQHSITKTHKCTRFCPGEVHNTGQSMAGNFCRQCTVLRGSHGASSSKEKVVVDNRILMKNRSLVDVRSQLLHRSLVEEVNKRRLFKTVGAVENIGFQAPIEVSKNVSRPSGDAFSMRSTKNGRKQGHQIRRN